MNQLYISTCPETGRRFLCEIGQDNNIAEIFERAEKVQALIDAYESLSAVLPLLLQANREHKYVPRLQKICELFGVKREPESL